MTRSIGSKARHLLFPMAAIGLFAIFTARLAAQEMTIRVGHFPYITHAQALVARNFERHDRDWFTPRLGPGIRIEWYAYNA